MNGTIIASDRLVQNAQDLRVYREAFALSLEIHKATLNFPKIEQYALGDQMRRASKSICANLAEGFARQVASALEFRRFITIAIGSASEMKVWVEYAYALGYINRDTSIVWLDKFDHICRMLQKLKPAL